MSSVPTRISHGSPIPGPKNKGRGKQRAIVLVLVHLAALIHVIHWKAAGSTISPIEPSESMQTLELGYLNAGFVFFTLAILVTAIFGRFFCGWGCHLVAVQDLCTWILKKMGINHKPLRSRLLMFVPILAAFYMFLWPQIARIWEGKSMPPILNHLSTENFWITFPGPVVAILTLVVCGFVAVLFLGNKGFCTYACPYGAFFSLADRVSPGRIRVTSACDGCAQCTAHCSSNVRVHEEVKAYGKVVNPGCMKCLDCVDSCPKQALYFGFKPEAGLKVIGQPPVSQKRVWDFSWTEEAVIAISFLMAFYAFRGLYEQIPFLLSLGLAALSSSTVIQLIQAFRKPNMRVFRWQVKRQGKFTSQGKGFVVAAVAVIALVVHSTVVQYLVHSATGDLLVAQNIYSGKVNQPLTVADEAAKRARSEFELSSKIGLIPVSSQFTKLGSIAVFLEDDSAAESYFLRALQLNEDSLGSVQGLAKLYFKQSKFTDAITMGERWAKLEPKSSAVWLLIGNSLVSGGQVPDAIPFFEKVVNLDPSNPDGFSNLGMAQAFAQKFDQAQKNLEAAIKLRPVNAQYRHNLALILASQGKRDEALTIENEVVKLDPSMSPAFFIRTQLAFELGDFVKTFQYAQECAGKDVDYIELCRMEAVAAHAIDKDESEIPAQLPESVQKIWKAARLHAANKTDEAEAIMNQVRESEGKPNLSDPW